MPTHMPTHVYTHVYDTPNHAPAPIKQLCSSPQAQAAGEQREHWRHNQQNHAVGGHAHQLARERRHQANSAAEAELFMRQMSQPFVSQDALPPGTLPPGAMPPGQRDPGTAILTGQKSHGEGLRARAERTSGRHQASQARHAYDTCMCACKHIN